MVGQSSPAAVVRFSAEVDPAARSALVEALNDAQIPASTGWELEYRSPQQEPDRVLALINHLRELSQTGAVAAGAAVRRWLRSVSAPKERVFAEMTDTRTGKTARISAGDTDLAFRLLRDWMNTPGGDAPATWNGLRWSQEPATPDAAPGPAVPEVFVSYAHDSEEHKDNVLRLCRLLAECGVATRMDRWSLDMRRDWQDWATREITTADYVIIVASPRCRLVGDGRNDPDTNRGLQAEMRLLRELYHSDYPQWSKKMLPVVLPGYSIEDIPLFLQPHTADRFHIDSYTPEGAEALLRLLHRRPPFTRPEVKPPPDLPPQAD